VDNNRIQWWEKRANGVGEVSLVVENEDESAGDRLG